MENFRLKAVYATITATVCLAMFCRLLYIQTYFEDEFSGHPVKKRLDIRFSFTQIAVINKWMLFWSVGVMVLIRVYLYGTN